MALRLPVRALIRAAALLACACTSSPGDDGAILSEAGPAPGELSIPLVGRAPVVHGVVGADEWKGAASIALDQGATVRILHDGARVYLAVSGVPGSGFGCVMVGAAGGVRVLHASAKLGSAIYTPDKSGAFHPRSTTYTWKPADRMLREEGWMASTVKDGHQQEFALSFALLGLPDRPARIALGFWHRTGPDPAHLVVATPITWPAGLRDGVGNAELLAGFNPPGLRFDMASWLLPRPQPAPAR